MADGLYNSPASRKVTPQEFLSQRTLKRGVHDFYDNCQFKHFRNINLAIAYERGRQIAAYARSKKYKIHDLYSSYGFGNPTDNLIFILRQMHRERIFV